MALWLQRASQEVKEAQMFREKMGTVSEWMGRVKLPRDLKGKIRAYYAEVWRPHSLDYVQSCRSFSHYVGQKPWQETLQTVMGSINSQSLC